MSAKPRNIVEEFAASNDAGWQLETKDLADLDYLYAQLDTYEDIYLVVNTAQAFYLINANFIRVRVLSVRDNGDLRT